MSNSHFDLFARAGLLFGHVPYFWAILQLFYLWFIVSQFSSESSLLQCGSSICRYKSYSALFVPLASWNIVHLLWTHRALELLTLLITLVSVQFEFQLLLPLVLACSVFLAWPLSLVIGLILLSWRQMSAQSIIYMEMLAQWQCFHVHCRHLHFLLWLLHPFSFHFWIMVYFVNSTHSMDLCPRQILIPSEDSLFHWHVLSSKMVCYGSLQVRNFSSLIVVILSLFLVGNLNSLLHSRAINICFAGYPEQLVVVVCSHRQILPLWEISIIQKCCYSLLLLWNMTRALFLCFQYYVFPICSDL